LKEILLPETAIMKAEKKIDHISLKVDDIKYERLIFECSRCAML